MGELQDQALGTGGVSVHSPPAGPRSVSYRRGPRPCRGLRALLLQGFGGAWLALLQALVLEP